MYQFNILVVLLYYNFAKCYLWENWVKCAWNLSALFLKAAHDPIIISKLKV